MATVPSPTRELDPAPWSIASDLPGRLRIRSRDLLDSPGLRHHCRQVLRSCHWLEDVRLNAVAGSVCIRYPVDRRGELEALLEQALRDSPVDDAMEALLVPGFGGQRVRGTLRHAAACLALIGLEASLGLPTVVVGGLTAVLLWPVLRQVLQELKRRELSLESLELTFSGLMVQQGYAAETLLDLAIGDAVAVVQSRVESEGLQREAGHLLERLGDCIQLSVITTAGGSEPLALRMVSTGQVIRLQRGETTVLSACLLEGSLVVVNRWLDGDWRPRQLQAGDRVEAGALILNGTAEAQVADGFAHDPAYALLHTHRASLPAATEGDRAGWSDRYKRVMPPLQLGLSAACLAAGSVDAALATLQFNALSDWEEQKLASELTAIADLRLHRLQSRSGPALQALGDLRHLVISRSCLEGMGGTVWRERRARGRTAPGTLLALLGGIQAWLCGDGGPELWFDPEQQGVDPVAIRCMTLGPLQEGWEITAEDGHRWRVRERQEAAGAGEASPGFALDVWREEVLLGQLVLRCEPERRWREMGQQLRALGIEVHLIGAEGAGPLQAVAEALGVDTAHSHKAATDLERWQVVKGLQDGGQRVGYLGSVLQDLPALEQADVSLGLNSEASSHVASLCDLALAQDILWLPRLIRISRGLRQTARQNFALVGSSQLAASLATAVGWIAPLQMVLLSDIPLLLAELNNLRTLKASGQPDHRSRAQRTQPSPPAAARAHEAQLTLRSC